MSAYHREKNAQVTQEDRAARNAHRRESGANRRYYERRLEREGPEGDRFRGIKYRHGITREQYEEMYAAQGGICAVEACDGEATHIDHDHSCCPRRGKGCGKCVRGLLCPGCNHALGSAQDDPDRLRAMADYLEMWALKDTLS